jgi:DNA helicase-2/ATP-dependent DNA helicase PcrA
VITAEKHLPNERQQECIDRVNGKVMVLAGPGTGKTFTLIQRIKSMLQSGVEPSSILCLTFSEAAAGEMRARLIKEMGAVASSVDIYTYHSFCNDIIKQHPMQFQLSANVRLITKTAQLELMKEAVDEAGLKFFVAPRADKYHFVNDFIAHIAKLKSLRIDEATYLSHIETNPSLTPRLRELEIEIAEREQNGKTQNKGRYAEVEKIKENIAKAKELWGIFEIYSRKMLEHNFIDFSDMINFVLDRFEDDKAFLREVGGKYKYLLVDEYQDTNALQNSIIFNMLDGMPEQNIFVVGDDDQIIYGFQGAKSDNVENFLTRYPDTKVICLEENNRSTQPVLDLGYRVISQDDTRLENNELFKTYNIRKRLTAKNPAVIAKTRKIRRWQFGDVLQEYNHIVDDIAAVVGSGVKLSEIAIISKKRKELETFAEMLKGKNIPYQINEGKSIFTIRASILIYFYLKALNNHVLNSDKLFGLLLAEPFNIAPEDYNKLLREHKINRKDFITNMRRLYGWENPRKIDGFLKTFDDLREYASTNNLRNTVVEIINRTGILKYYFECEKNKAENIAGVKKIIDEATEFSVVDPSAGVAEFVAYLDNSFKNDIDITVDSSSLVQNAVQLITYHGSKGREFEHVYLPNLVKNNWEDFRMAGEYKFITDEVLDKETAQRKKDAELLRLLFVGITRAKYALTLSFADNCEGSARQVTKYLNAASDFDFDNAQFEFNDEEFAKEFFRSISRDVFDNRKAFETEIRERVADVVLSPSRMNDYLECPQKFFYTKVLKIDVEERDWDAPNFGNVVHSVLEKAARQAKTTGSYPSADAAAALFKQAMDRTAFTSLARKEMYEKHAKNIFENYYPNFAQTPPTRIAEVEFSFDSVEVSDGDLVSGKIDRIEKNSDGTYELYDYKTGKPPSQADVAPGGKRENYFNQLCFYKYAFEKLTGKKVARTGLIYVEDHERNVYKELTDDDMRYVEDLIMQTYANIRALRFAPDQKPDTCKYCAYKQLCKLEVV